MGRPPCCDKSNVKRGLWTAEEDAKILAYVSRHGVGNWTLVPQKAGLNRCAKSCRLRWTNYLRPDLRHDNFSPSEEDLIINFHRAVGSRWSLIAKQLPGRTDNDVKNYWNTRLRKKLLKMGIDPITHKPISQIFIDFGNISNMNSNIPHVGPSWSSLINNMITANPKPDYSTSPPPPPAGPATTNSPLNPANTRINIMNQTPSSWNHMIMSSTAPQLHQNISQDHDSYFIDDAIITATITTTTTSSSSASSSSSNNRIQPISHQPDHQTMTSSSSTNNRSFDWNEYSDDLLHDFDIKRCIISEQISAINGDHDHQEQISLKEEGSTSSAGSASFVDTILDRDTEIRPAFPELWDGCFDY